MAAAEPPRVVLLMGPTAAGKTELAVALCERFPLDIVSVDSAMVYRGMDIGTAKPEPEVLRRAPHRLIDIRDPWERYSAAEFAADAAREIRTIHAAGRGALLVGGTMLYFRALTEGLSPLPAADPALRARLELEAARDGWPALHRRLAAIDPAAASRIHPNDPQRIQRALEVARLTGSPISELQGASGEKFDARYLKLVAAPTNRKILHQRIEHRFDRMLAAGLLKEVSGLKDDPRMHRGLPSMRAVGYRQIWQHLEGRFPLSETRNRAVAATRQLAKRQLSWLRGLDGADWLDSAAPDGVAKAIAAVGRFVG